MLREFFAGPSRKGRLLSLLLLTVASSAFANDANANLGQVMAAAAVNQWIKMVPLFLLALGIAVFFALVQKYPQKAMIGCSGFCAVGLVLGLVVWFVEFVAAHAFVFLLLAIGLVFAGLIIFMMYSPPSAPQKQDEYDSQKDKNNPFYEGPR